MVFSIQVQGYEIPRTSRFWAFIDKFLVIFIGENEAEVQLTVYWN